MTTNASRREFMRRASAMATTGVAAPLALNLSAMANASAANATGYKALVCVYLDGGNDHASTVIPYDDANYETYRLQRPNLLPQKSLLQSMVLNGTLPGGRRYALTPELDKLRNLFNSGRASMLMNIGSMMAPTTRDDFFAGRNLPPRLGSHNDQRSFYLSGLPEGGTTGWAGRMGDMLATGANKSIFTAIGVGGSGVFLSGDETIGYSVSTSGAIRVKAINEPTLYGSAANRQLLEQLVTTGSPSLFANEYATIVKRSIDTERKLTPALNGTPTRSKFPGGGLSSKLAMVSRLIASRDVLGPKRQVFFVSLGGFDTHSELLERHEPLMQELDTALNAFQAELELLGVQNEVTTFTASEFGRTVNQNGDGSDHGWGSMQFIMGGAIKGGTYFGKAPTIGAQGQDDLGRGRLCPTMSTDQMAYSLGAWMGLSKSELEDVLPKITNFAADKRAIQFFKTPLVSV